MEQEVVKFIREKAETIRNEYGYKERIIGEDIFKIVRNKGCILFYPLQDEPDLDGFHIRRTISGEEKAFIYINTAKSVEKNIFCAAHELGHIYEIEKAVKEKYPQSEDLDEDIINRFAAELLMPYQEFCKLTKEKLDEMSDGNNRISVNDILKMIVYLMDYYFVPYKSVIYRLEETGFISLEACNQLESYDEIVKKYIFEGNYTKLMRKNDVKDFDGLQDDLIFAKDNRVYGNAKIKKIQEDFDIPETDEKKKQEYESTFVDLLEKNQ